MVNRRGERRGRARGGTGRRSLAREPQRRDPLYDDQDDDDDDDDLLEYTPDAFELYDRWGNAHEYVLDYYPAAKGFDMKCMIVSLLGPELAKLDGMDEEKISDLDPVKLIALLGSGLAGIGERILKRGGHKLVLSVFSHTKRDGRSLADKGRFNMSFRGNQLELDMAIGKVIWSNYEDFFGVGSSFNGQESDEPAPERGDSQDP